MKFLIHILVLVLLINTIQSQNSNNNCKGSINPNTVWEDEPVFVNKVQNGILFKTGPVNNTVNVLHVYGSPYEMGYAHGQLLAKEINTMLPQFMQYADESMGEILEKYLSLLPEFMVKIIEELGVNVALDYIAFVTKQYTAPEFFEELQGLADGSGVEHKLLIRLHMFPELIKAHCSILGAWGEATQAELGGGLLQLRALDWGINNPLVAVPTFIVYHPSNGNGHDFSILSWSGYIGALTGYSQSVGVSQKVWIKYNGTYTYEGIPFYFNLRNMLQYDNSIDEVLNRIYNTARTCSIFLGIGSNESNTAVVVEYSHDVVRVFDPETPFPAYAPTSPQHPTFQDLVYVDKHTQPSTDPCMASLLSQYYGDLSPSTLISTVSQFQTGDIHAAIYDFSNNFVYISVATSSQPQVWPLENPSAISPAYNNQWIQLNMNQLFNLNINSTSSSN